MLSFFIQHADGFLILGVTALLAVILRAAAERLAQKRAEGKEEFQPTVEKN